MDRIITDRVVGPSGRLSKYSSSLIIDAPKMSERSKESARRAAMTAVNRWALRIFSLGRPLSPYRCCLAKLWLRLRKRELDGVI